MYEIRIQNFNYLQVFDVPRSSEWAQNELHNPEFRPLINSFMNSGLWRSFRFRAHSDERGTTKIRPFFVFAATMSFNSLDSKHVKYYKIPSKTIIQQLPWLILEGGTRYVRTCYIHDTFVTIFHWGISGTTTMQWMWGRRWCEFVKGWAEEGLAQIVGNSFINFRYIFYGYILPKTSFMRRSVLVIATLTNEEDCQQDH